MAYWIAAGGNPGASRQVQFYMDEDSDKNNLPTASASGVKQGGDSASYLPVGKGSVALSISSGKLFILNSSDEWVQMGG